MARPDMQPWSNIHICHGQTSLCTHNSINATANTSKLRFKLMFSSKELWKEEYVTYFYSYVTCFPHSDFSCSIAWNKIYISNQLILCNKTFKKIL
jgi:hypothetical protein